MKKKNCVNLFLQVFLLSAFTFGGGYTIVSLMQKKFVDELSWLTKDEMLEIVAIAQSGCGAVVVNTSIMLGYYVLGFRGAVSALCGTILPPFVIIIPITIFYDYIKDNTVVAFFMRAVRAGVLAVIMSTIISMLADLVKLKNVLYYVLFIISFVLAFFTDINIVFIIAFCIVVGIVYTAVTLKGARK